MRLLAALGIIFSLSLYAEEIPQNDKTGVKEALLEMCDDADFIFIGETGTTEDEQVVFDLLADLKACGVSTIAINKPMYSRYKDKINKAGIKEMITDFTRENSVIADELLKKKPGKDSKVLVIGNSMLTLLKDGQVRWLVDQKYKTSGATIESITALMTTSYLLGDLSKAKQIFSATDRYFLSQDKKIEDSFAVKTKDLKSLEFRCLDEQCKYKRVFDYVIFLDRGDSLSNEEGKKLMEDYKKGRVNKKSRGMIRTQSK
jgi:hypothetical protein